ncbi:hypothetical protein [Pontibacter harenae]|uniref:hypothetical protein n=1 Tax=Pontibacter harenae TaxID=2894083 RepID=UPI001E5459D4|nr:hypothetical protein [Pontibacter harenae]MCC9168912.1 hypothetical protein [Pontibacter harenae]
MEIRSSSLGSVVALKQDILEKIEGIISKGRKSSFSPSEDKTKAVFKKKLKAASTKYKIMLPFTIVMGGLFAIACLAQLFEYYAFFELFAWQNGALFFLLTFSLSIQVSHLKQQIERYKMLIYLFEMVDRLEELK